MSNVHVDQDRSVIASPIRIAVLSVVKHEYVARGIASHPHCQLVVVADDADQPEWVHERNQEFANSFGIPYQRNVEQAIEAHAVDAVVVSSEAERHCDLSIRAARLKKHIVQDKPVGTRRADVERLVREVESAGVKFLLWNRNYFPAVQHAKRQIDAGVIGDVRAIHVDFYFAKDAGPVKGSRKPGYPPMDWLAYQIGAHVDGSDGAIGRTPIGELTNEGIYPLGYIRLLAQREARRVFAQMTSHFHQVNVDNHIEDLATVTLEMEGGLIGSMAVGRIGASSHPSGGEIKFHVVGTKGALVFSESRPDVGIFYRDQPAKEFRQRRVANANDFLLADDFVRAIETGSRTMLDVHDSLAIFSVIEAAIRSGQTGRVEPC